MANLKTDSPFSRRIVLAFLDFLNSVEPAPGVDLEGLEVARECLTEVFNLNSPSVDHQTKPNLLVDIFSSLETSKHQEINADLGNGVTSADAPGSSSTQNTGSGNLSEASKSLAEDWMRERDILGASKDELFGQFFAALEKVHFLRTTPDGNDDPIQLDKATHIFHNALNEMEKSGCQTYNLNNLAETLKSQGNRAMQSKLYPDAIELYTCATALCQNNAVYYCNRAAAYTQIQKYAEAIKDCLKSIAIDPNYSKAYSRLGLAYYAQGNYSDAINKGFKKALQLDPNNEAVKENIRVADQKLKEELQRAERDQNTSSASHNTQESNDQSPGGSRSHANSFSFSSTGVPTDFASMFMNMAANAYQGQQSHNRAEDNGNVNGSDEPEIRIGGNISMNFGEQMPEDLQGALRSVMEMISGAAPQGNPHDTMNGSSSSPD